MKTVVIELSVDEAEYLVTKLTGGAEAAPNDTEQFWMAKMRDRVKDAIVSRDAAEAEQRLMASTGFGPPPSAPPPPQPAAPFSGFSGSPLCSKPGCTLKLPHPVH